MKSAFPAAAALLAAGLTAAWAADPLTLDETLRREFAAPPGGRVELDTDTGPVRVLGTNVPVVIIEVTRRARVSGERGDRLIRGHAVTFSEDGGVIRMQARRPAGTRLRWGRSDLHVEVRAWVPERFNVSAHTSGGEVTVRGVEGDLKASTSGGSVELVAVGGTVSGRTSGGSIHGRELTGEVVLDTSGGGISVRQFTGSRLDVRTSGGSISLRDVTGAVNARTSGGGIEIEAAAGPLEARSSGGSVRGSLREAPAGPVSLSTSGGGVTLELPAGAGFELDAGTSAGGVTSDFPVKLSGGAGSRSASGPVNGGGPRVTLKSSGGSIHLRQR